MKVIVYHFVSDSYEVMTALIVVLPLIVVVEISLQLHRSSICVGGSRIPSKWIVQEAHRICIVASVEHQWMLDAKGT
jgi:ABC-type maltose transport system permease subunit